MLGTTLDYLVFSVWQHHFEIGCTLDVSFSFQPSNQMTILIKITIFKKMEIQPLYTRKLNCHFVQHRRDDGHRLVAGNF